MTYRTAGFQKRLHFAVKKGLTFEKQIKKGLNEAQGGVFDCRIEFYRTTVNLFRSHKQDVHLLVT